MRIEPFKPEHIKEVIFNELPDTEESRNLVAKNASNSVAFTVFCDEGNILFVGGLFNLWGKVYEVWLFTTKTFYRKLKQSITAANRLYAQMKNFPYARLQADIRADLTRNLRFVEHFGFKYESTMLKYGYNEETYLRYVRLSK